MIKERMIEYNQRIELLKQYLASGSFVSGAIPMSVTPGQKYVPPSVKKKNSGLFSKKEKKSWKRF
jgi:hypothetical protein